MSQPELARPRFGILLPTPWDDAERRDAAAYVSGVEAMVEEAAGAGWDGIFCAHHLLSEVPMLQPFQLLSYLASGAGKMDLGTAILVLPLLNPIEVAEQAATLDQLSGGRLILGVGAGYRPREFESMGVPLKGRGRRLVEYVEIVKQLWRQEPATFDGEFFQYRDVRPSVYPVQRSLRIWVGAQRRPTVERALRIADGWLAPGNSPDPEWLPRMAQTPGASAKADRPLLIELHVDESTETAIATCRPYLRREYSAYGEQGSPDWFETEFEQLLHRSFVLGDPEHVTAQLRRYQEMGFNYFVCRLAWGGLPIAQALSGMRLLQDEVWPRLAPAASEA
jgi:alkanesulfonate monooxygenase SsuD/methylene tetrahydromethanopterin reductase-like flavin-dependent oxidoreductase (luciferase family)